MDCTSHIRVVSPSSVRTYSLRKAFINTLERCGCNVPSHHHGENLQKGGGGGLNVHCMLRCGKNSVIAARFQSLMVLCNSFLPRTKFPPLSELTSCGTPLLAMKRRMLFKTESVSRLWTTLMWIGRIAIQVNNTPYLLAVLLPRRTSANGPKQSTPTNVKIGLSGVVLSLRKLAIFCCPTGGCRFLHWKQPFRFFLTAELPLTIQNRSLIMDKTCSDPEWLDS